MKKFTPAMLRNALRMFRGLMKQAKQHLKDPKTLNHLLLEALLRASASGGKLWQDIHLLVRLIKAWKNGAYKGVSVQTLVAIVAAILYFVSPLDVIPDFIPGVGYVDDAAVIAWVLNSITHDLNDFRAWEQDRGEIIDHDPD